MAFTIDDAFLPAALSAPPMSDREFADFCAEHPDLSMTAEGEIVAMPPNYSLTGLRNPEIIVRMDRWANRDGRGILGDSSTGFVLPNGARRSPDASWTSKSVIRQLSKEELEGYWHLCPAFIIELRSQSDRLRVLREKMREYTANGAQLGWLIDPETRSVEVYRPNREPQLLEGLETLEGEAPVDGFLLDLRRVWDPLAA